MAGKRIQFDDETWGAIDLLARDRMMDFQELADEAFRDILKKYNRPTELVKALRRSAEAAAPAPKASPPAVDPSRRSKRSTRRAEARPRRKRRPAG
jgi:hypothetical protein